MRSITYFIFTLVIVGASELPEFLRDAGQVTNYVADLVLKNNFQTVVPNRFYRSGEMSSTALGQIITTHQIKTVIDLRMHNSLPDRAGMPEQAVVNAAGAKYIHIPVSSRRVLSLEQLEKLFHAYDSAQLPVLVHCTSGTHRAGVAAAIWLIDRERIRPIEAQNQLSIRYGFFRFERLFVSRMQGEPTLDSLIWKYIKEPHSAEGFRVWAKKHAIIIGPFQARV